MRCLRCHSPLKHDFAVAGRRASHGCAERAESGARAIVAVSWLGNMGQHDVDFCQDFQILWYFSQWILNDIDIVSYFDIYIYIVSIVRQRGSSRWSTSPCAWQQRSVVPASAEPCWAWCGFKILQVSSTFLSFLCTKTFVLEESAQNSAVVVPVLQCAGLLGILEGALYVSECHQGSGMWVALSLRSNRRHIAFSRNQDQDVIMWFLRHSANIWFLFFTVV